MYKIILQTFAIKMFFRSNSNSGPIQFQFRSNLTPLFYWRQIGPEMMALFTCDDLSALVDVDAGLCWCADSLSGKVIPDA